MNVNILYLIFSRYYGNIEEYGKGVVTMGTSYKYKCDECGFEEEYFVGGRLMTKDYKKLNQKWLFLIVSTFFTLLPFSHF